MALYEVVVTRPVAGSSYAVVDTIDPSAKTTASAPFDVSAVDSGSQTLVTIRRGATVTASSCGIPASGSLVRCPAVFVSPGSNVLRCDGVDFTTHGTLTGLIVWCQAIPGLMPVANVLTPTTLVLGSAPNTPVAGAPAVICTPTQTGPTSTTSNADGSTTLTFPLLGPVPAVGASISFTG